MGFPVKIAQRHFLWDAPVCKVLLLDAAPVRCIRSHADAPFIHDQEAAEYFKRGGVTFALDAAVTEPDGRRHLCG